jgi:hypothetical protein
VLATVPRMTGRAEILCGCRNPDTIAAAGGN